MSSKPHLNNFDFVRVVAALCVVVSHQFALNGLHEPTLLNLHSVGGVGVLIFFSVSGYLVSQSWSADPHLLRFAARRLLRIWPGLAAVVLLSTFVWGPIVSPLPFREYLRQPQIPDYLHNLVFDMRGALPVNFVGNAIPFAVNGPLWTIPLELKCYVVLAVLGVSGLLRWKWLIVVLTAMLVARYALVEARGDILANNMAWTLEQRFLLEFGLFFAAGVLLQYFFHGSAKRLAAIVAASWVAGLIAIHLGRPLFGLLLILPCTVLWIATASTPVLRRCGRFGDFSYGLYIFAFPIQQTLVWLNKGRLSWAPLFVVTLIACFAMAFLSWHVVEKRALRLKPSRPKASAEPMATPAAAVQVSEEPVAVALQQ
jgi:peptidoglycan/LPS O-acetylase OafA/YrhL